ncbi:MAG TPA: hypothetical protein VFU33_03730 [Gaiellaceae bacterium]|nr:hypothetical protein [Gaiellaceae bacterium]
MLRPVRVVPLLAVLASAGVALVAPGPAAARTEQPGAPFTVAVVDRMSHATFELLAKRGAVGLLRPGYGPTTNRRRALAELVRGAEVNARLGGVPRGRPLINANKIAAFHECQMCIVLKLPPRGRPLPNQRLYRIAVIGRGYHGLLTSPTTRIPGLVSIVDVAPTALGHAWGGMSWTPSGSSVEQLDRLGAQVHGEDRLKYAGVFIAAAIAMLLALLGWDAVRTAIPAALLANLALGVFQITNEVAIVAVFTTLSALGAVWLARICRDDLRLLGLIVLVLLSYLVVFVVRPAWAAVTPLGPDQNLRFWGIGDQIATLLFAPLLMGAVIARQRLGWVGFALFSLLGLFVMTDNRLGANGGGAIGLGLALAVLGARLSRRRRLTFACALTATAAIVLAIVRHGLAAPGPNHLRSAFGSGITGFLDVAVNRVPLVYAPAVHEWPLTLPLAVLLVACGVLAFRVTRDRAAHDLLLALATGLIASLLVNDATGFMLAAGIACASAVARFAPSGAPVRLPVPASVARGRATYLP